MTAVKTLGTFRWLWQFFFQQSTSDSL